MGECLSALSLVVPERGAQTCVVGQADRKRRKLVPGSQSPEKPPEKHLGKHTAKRDSVVINERNGATDVQPLPDVPPRG
jgi:hypothetical protein